MQRCVHLFCLWEGETEGSHMVISGTAAALKLPLPATVAAIHLILQCGKLLKDVAEFISLSSTIVPMDLDEAAEWLQGELATTKQY